MNVLFIAAAAGLAAGMLNGFFGGGGGLILIPVLGSWGRVDDRDLFPTSISIMLPISILTLVLASRSAGLPWQEAAPYLLGSAAGGILVGLFGKSIPTVWLHRILGVMLLWGGVRYLC